jgi:hypothetical protein
MFESLEKPYLKVSVKKLGIIFAEVSFFLFQKNSLAPKSLTPILWSLN